MKSSAKKVELASVDDLFSTEESRADAQREKVLEIPLSELHPFKDHPFKVKDDEAMMETADSIRQYGVLVPAIARPDPNGGYELVAGHRRHRASELAGKDTMPVIVRDLDDDQATIIMVDSNLQRESLLPSERAFAYKMKLEAVKHQGARTDLTSRQLVGKLEMADVVGEKAGDSGRQVQRYIRLTELIPELLDMVDEKKIAFNPAYELSFLLAVGAVLIAVGANLLVDNGTLIAQALGVRCVLQTAGHQSAQQLRATGAPVVPDVLAAAQYCLNEL